MNKVSVIIPFLNEEENIPFLTDSLSRFFSGIQNFQAEVIFVDDGSTDGSVAVLRQQKHEGYLPKLISFSKNFGSHAALRAGVLHASGDFITFMYADLQDPVELVDKMFEETTKDSHTEIVWASRSATDNGFFERTFSKTYAGLMRKYVSSLYPTRGFDVVMFSKKVGALLNNNIESNSSIFLQILTFGFKHDFVHYEKRLRNKGKSKWTLSKKIKLFVDSFVAFSYAPIRFVTSVGIFMFIIGVLFSGYLLIRKLVHNDLVSGWPMLISILMLGFGITNISLGIIAEYLWRTLDSSRKRPVFIIDEVTELK